LDGLEPQRPPRRCHKRSDDRTDRNPLHAVRGLGRLGVRKRIRDRDIALLLGAATAASLWPRLRAVTFDSFLANPARLASNASAMLPECDTKPVPSVDTDNPDDRAICFTCEVPLSLGQLNSLKSKFFYVKALSRILSPCQVTTVNDPAWIFMP